MFFILAVTCFFLWIKTVSVNGYLHRQHKKSQKTIKSLKKEIVDTKKDFYNALDEIKKNEKIKPVFDSTTTVTILFDKMRDRFETDGISLGKH